jgi:dihydrofolate reductase
MPPGLRVVGFAIVSADGMIADANGEMPASIMHPADQRFFAEGLAQVDVVVHGRHSHEQQPQSPQRRRLVMTRRVSALAPYPENSKAMLWNPDGASLERACAALGVTEGTVAVIGGTVPFGYFLPRYDVFHLSRAGRARIPGGLPVFPGIPPKTPEELLQQHGMYPSPVELLDAKADVTVTTWQR